APVAAACSSACEDESTYLVSEMSCTCALPPDPVLDECRSAEFARPQDQARIGTSPLCLEWSDEPSIETLPLPNLMCMSNAMAMLPSMCRGRRPHLGVVRATPRRRARTTCDRSGRGFGRQARDQAQGHGQAFELVVRLEVELRAVVARRALDLLYHHLGGGQRLARLGVLAGVGRVAVDVVEDPVLQPALDLVAAAERADLVAHDALEVVREARAGEHVRQARGQRRIGGRVGVVE